MMSEAKSSKPDSPAVGGKQDLLPRETDFTSNKAFLLTASSKSGVNLYDHLVFCLKKILEEKPKDVVDIFEDISKEGKRARFSSNVDTVQNQHERTTEVARAEIQRHLFEHPDHEEDEEADSALPNLWQTAYLFEQGGIGVDAEETYRLWLSLKQLEKQHSFEKLRFWGKILGTEGGYYIAEGTMKPEALADDEETKAEAAADANKTAEAAAAEEAKPDADEEPEDPIPKPEFKPPPIVPKEDAGTGANRFVYFVCNEPGKPWTRLPNVTPAQLQVSRKIKKFFTGRLNAPVVTYPPFPGNEANYLRAQIARISAGTIISPQGFYMFDEEEEEDEEGGGRDSFVENPEFEAMGVRELIDPGLASWVHHVQHILPQGRTRWWNPAQKRDDESANEEEDEEEKEEMDEPQPEEGPPLLTPLSEDAEVDNQQSWTGRLSSQLLPQFAVAVMSSNLWPGAHAVATGRLFENVYIGWGHKYATENYSPPPPPPVLLEFPSGPEITETEDPTPEEEAALKAAMAEAEGGAEEGGEAEEEEEEEDD